MEPTLSVSAEGETMLCHFSKRLSEWEKRNRGGDVIYSDHPSPLFFDIPFFKGATPTGSRSGIGNLRADPLRLVLDLKQVNWGLMDRCLDLNGDLLLLMPYSLWVSRQAANK